MRPLAGAEARKISRSARIVELVSEGECARTWPAVDRSVEAVAWGRRRRAPARGGTVAKAGRGDRSGSSGEGPGRARITTR